jgi:hypothetical protein
MSLRPKRLFKVLIIMAICKPSAAAIDQQFVPANWGTESNVGAGNIVDWAQTFTVGISGLLTGFDVWVDRPSAVTMPLLYDIRKTFAGVPTEPDTGSDILASGSVNALSIPVYSNGNPRSPLSHVDISSFPVTVGDVLAIVLRSDDPGTGCCGYTYSWMGDDPASVYIRGNAFIRAPGGIFDNWTIQDQDQAFRTYVNAIPEPSCATLIVLAVTWISMFGHGRGGNTLRR